MKLTQQRYKDGLYNPGVFFADEFYKVHNYLEGFDSLYFSYHLKQRVGTMYNRAFTLSDITLDKISRGRIFEIEVQNNCIVKVGLRIQFNKLQDLCVIIMPQVNGLFVKTAWLNSVKDNHRTLDAGKYIHA